MTINEIKEALFDYITDEINIEDITSIESNCGTLWIDFKDGSTKSLSLMETEGE